MKQKMAGPNMQQKPMESAKKAEAAARTKMPIFSITGEGSNRVSIRLYNTQATRISPVYKYFLTPQDAMSQLKSAAAHPDAKGIQIQFENVNGGKAQFIKDINAMEGFKTVNIVGTGQFFLEKIAQAKISAQPMSEAPMQ